MDVGSLQVVKPHGYKVKWWFSWFTPLGRIRRETDRSMLARSILVLGMSLSMTVDELHQQVDRPWQRTSVQAGLPF